MSQKIRKIGIVEDEVLIAESLQRNLTKHGYEVLPYAIDYDEAVEMIEGHTPDLIILDINLESRKDGIDVAQRIKEDYKIPFIYLTSHLDERTLSAAKKTGPSGYLTKPFHFESLYTTIEVALHNSNPKNPEDEMINLKTGAVNERIPVKDILYLKSDHVYVEVVLADRKLVVRNSLKNLLEELPEKIFFQVHRSYAINIRHVVSFGAGILLIGKEEIPVSRSYQNELLDRLQ